MLLVVKIYLCDRKYPQSPTLKFLSVYAGKRSDRLYFKHKQRLLLVLEVAIASSSNPIIVLTGVKIKISKLKEKSYEL
jgi:hypothetical protein